MCYNWYTCRDVIRTRREIRKGEALVPFQVVDDDFQMIIINVDGIDEGLDDVPAEERIFPVTFVEPAEEEENTVPVVIFSSFRRALIFSPIVTGMPPFFI